MKLTNLTKIKLRLVLVISAVWLLIAIFITIHDHFFYKEVNDLARGAYSFSQNLYTSIFAVFIAGPLAGSLVVFYLKDRYKDKPLWQALLFNTITFVLIITVVCVPAAFFFSAFNTENSWNSPESMQLVTAFFTSVSYINILINWTLISFLTLIVLQINDKYGQGVMFDLLRGKYNKPQQEERIFMFLDITSSTTIAEKLGNTKYFELLRTFFDDITRPIIKNQGEIYQYVGDEIVVSWKKKNGLKNANCLQCYFDIEKKINKLSEQYMQSYGLVPGYKAGLHCGEVTVGEVGSIKKDIIFSGDVLNTTARIQDACKRFDTKLLISKQLIAALDNPQGFKFKEIGEIQLRGKQLPVNLSIVEKSKEVTPSKSVEHPGKITVP